MSRADLTPVSYVVLGLVARDGPSTPYELKAAVGRGIAPFWPFPHSQIYSETERLARLGLLAEEREHTGRRRRSYRITAAGHAALGAWLAEPTSEALQIRSLAFLKLFFGQFAAPEDIAALTRAQVERYERELEVVEELLDRLKARGDRPWQLAVGELFAGALGAITEQWQRIDQLAEDRSRRAGAG
jgi:PadR family transcriptional regulator AphA